ncbi:MAG: PLP-dependent aminotransferase family protein [Pseudomonadota bacterium]
MIVPDTRWQPDAPIAGQAKYKALAQAIREGIVSKQLTPGEKLPPVRDLAFKIGVTPGTVARAYALLTDEGRLVAGVGRGTFVADTETSRPPPIGDAPLMYDTEDLPADKTQLISPVVPEFGQGEIIRDHLRGIAAGITSEALMNYPSRQSDAASRQAEFDRLKEAPVGDLTVNDIIATNGGQNAISLILQTVLHGHHPVVAMDELGYGGIRTMGTALRAEVLGIPWDDEGPDPNVFEHYIKTRGVQVFGTAAEINNPTVQTTSARRRQDIADLAQRYGVHVIDDDCFGRKHAERIGPSYRELLPDLGWYVTSPSKTITPALRIGFAVAPRGWATNLARTATYNHFGVTRIISDLYAAVATDRRLPAIQEKVSKRYAQDIAGAVKILEGYDIKWAEDVPYLWLMLPDGWRAGAFKQAADAEGVVLKSAEDFTLRNGPSVQAVRVAVNGHYSHYRFIAAVRVLRRLLDHPLDQMSV